MVATRQKRRGKKKNKAIPVTQWRAPCPLSGAYFRGAKIRLHYMRAYFCRTRHGPATSIFAICQEHSLQTFVNYREFVAEMLDAEERSFIERKQTEGTSS